MSDAQSPLAEAVPSSLEEYFSSSPLERTDAEWLVVVEALRTQRAKWVIEQETGAKRVSSAAAKKPPKITATAALSLDDIEFE